MGLGKAPGIQDYIWECAEGGEYIFMELMFLVGWVFYTVLSIVSCLELGSEDAA